MTDTHLVFGLLTILFAVSGLFVLLVRAGREESQAAGRIFPVAVLLQYRWFRYAAALSLFVLATVSGLELLSQL